MEVNPIAWHDLIALYRYRNHTLCLDSALGLTRGNLIGSNALLSYLRMEYSSYTAIARPGKGEKPHVGQVRFNVGEQFARLSFFAPVETLENRSLLALLDHLAWECGNRRALRLLAEIDEDDPCFEAFRQAGFMVYGRQRIWKIPASQQDTHSHRDNPWVTLNAASQFAIQNLYHAIVPPLVQGAEAMDKRPVHGLGYSHNGELLAFVEVIHGPLGIFLLPVVHPNLRHPVVLLETLINQLPALFGRPVYLAVREYQSWLNSAAETMQGEPSQQKVLMVKHLVRQQRVGVTQTLRKVLENHGTEPSAPIIQHSRRKE